MTKGVTTPKLVSAVCNAGFIGSHGVAMLTPDQIKSEIAEIRQNIVHNAPFCINTFILPTPPTHETNPKLSDELSSIRNVLDKYYNELGINQPAKYDIYGQNFLDQLQVILEENPPIVSFTFNTLTKEQLNLLKKKDIITIGTATNIKEAEYLYELGFDAITGYVILYIISPYHFVIVISPFYAAQGMEAGGHRGTFIGGFDESLIGLSSLLPAIIDKIDNKIPVIGAGGIMDGRGYNVVRALGADGASMGTVFMNCKECEIPDCYKKILRDERYNDLTEVTNKFSGRAARGIVNKFTMEMREIPDNSIPIYPLMNKLTGLLRAEAKKQERTDLMSLWCGQGAPLLRNYQYNITVEDLVQRIVNEADIILKDA